LAAENIFKNEGRGLEKKSAGWRKAEAFIRHPRVSEHSKLILNLLQLELPLSIVSTSQYSTEKNTNLSLK